MGEFGQDAGVTPLLFSKDILGFLMTTESQNLCLMSQGQCFFYIIVYSISYNNIFLKLHLSGGKKQQTSILL